MTTMTDTPDEIEADLTASVNLVETRLELICAQKSVVTIVLAGLRLALFATHNDFERIKDRLMNNWKLTYGEDFSDNTDIGSEMLAAPSQMDAVLISHGTQSLAQRLCTECAGIQTNVVAMAGMILAISRAKMIVEGGSKPEVALSCLLFLLKTLEPENGPC